MHFVVKTVGKQRTNGPVNQATGESFKFAGLGFTFEEAARNLACGVGFLDVVDGQGEKVLASFGVFRADDGGEDHGVIDIDQHRTAGLAGNFAGFHGDRVLAPLESFAYFVE